MLFGTDSDSTVNGEYLSAFVCHNAQTKQFHCEQDCSYTLIGVPCTDDNLCREGSFVFMFQINHNKTIIINQEPGTVMYYAGHSILHRQISLIDNARNEVTYDYWNLAAYVNKALCSRIRKSLIRRLER